MPRPKKEFRCEGPRFTSSKGWMGRVWWQGVRSDWLPLGTTDRELARKRLEAWARTGNPPAAKRGERSFSDEARRVLDEKAAKAKTLSETKAVQYRRDRLRKYAEPVLGPVPVGLLEPSHIAGVLDRMAEQGAALRTIHNLRSDISVILAKLVREGELKLNPAKDLSLPEEATVDTRERMHLSDEQMITFQTRRGFNTPLDMNILLCRCVSAQRTSDGHAGDWSRVDLVDFAWMEVRRPKTDGQVGAKVGARRAQKKNYEHVVHVVHEQYRPALRAYWESQGCPKSGPMFPLQRDAVATPMKLKDGRVIERSGGKAGERKGRGTSYAKAFRKAVWDEEIYSPLPAGTVMADGTVLAEGFDPAKPDPGKCAFQTDTAATRRLTFHGIRADLNSALMEAGTTDDQRILIVGHTQAGTGHKHYMRKVLVEVPSAALPGMTPDKLSTPPGAGAVTEGGRVQRAVTRPATAPSGRPDPAGGAYGGFIPAAGSKPLPVARVMAPKSSETVARPTRFERVTFGSVDAGSIHEPAQTQVDTASARALVNPSEGVSSQALGRNPSPRDALLEEAARAAREGDWERVDRIRAELSSPPRLTLVHKRSRVDQRRR